jgi:hypothetical protein
MQLYAMWLDALLGDDPAQLDSYAGHLFKMAYAMQLASSRGWNVLEGRYPGLCAWLGGYYQLKALPDDSPEKITDLRAEECEPNLTEDEQAELLAAYWHEEPDTRPGASPTAKIRTPLGAAHPAVQKLLEAQAANEKMPPSFSVYDHYPGLLLLASEVAIDYLYERKFDPEARAPAAASLAPKARAEAVPGSAAVSVRGGCLPWLRGALGRCPGLLHSVRGGCLPGSAQHARRLPGSRPAPGLRAAAGPSRLAYGWCVHPPPPSPNAALSHLHSSFPRPPSSLLCSHPPPACCPPP